MFTGDIPSVIDKLTECIHKFDNHGKEGCDCLFCTAHDTILTARAMLQKHLEEISPEKVKRCPKCGYSKADAQLHMDHHLCHGKIPD
jgi:hypothetical protein